MTTTEAAVPDQTTQVLPAILAGPILRHVSKHQLVLWLVTSQSYAIQANCYQGDTLLAAASFSSEHTGSVMLGRQAFLHLLIINIPAGLPEDTWLSYDLGLQLGDQIQWLVTTAPHILYTDEKRPRFAFKPNITQVLHGSCRKPHYVGGDALLVVDQQLAEARALSEPSEQPSLLMMTGDQVYNDDVSGPMLHAIHTVITQLGLYEESLDQTELQHSRELHGKRQHYYRRPELLPSNPGGQGLRKIFRGARKPIFTSANADNHLATLAEVLGMYLLVWSPALWPLVNLDDSTGLDGEALERYQAQLPAIKQFAKGLPRVQRVLASIPTYMIFDDHDITDDWNLSRDWEENAYGHPLSRRIIGNCLIAYLLCQAWGNAPERFPEPLIKAVQALFRTGKGALHDLLIDQLLKREGWHYSLATQPKIVVLDTRTQRWRSETSAADPSGLMDWEMLTELQQELIHEKAVILVSPAPIFGVKLIEVVQRVFTWFGGSLMVDAENWMAHPGSANVILNIFRHRRTPHNFTILSGDVHYSFVYDVRLRHHEQTPHIWQITASGIKNAFPEKLLKHFDWLNRWLFASYSPLNWLTRRRHMRIQQRRPSEHSGRYPHQRLYNGSGIGRVFFDENGAPERIQILSTRDECIQFNRGYESDWMD
ncbi:alkaline phosphatase D family protein [uncultured Thiothrix sp.]|uniref:alkaline phosphatase D family protein n=1 Tax=uncultured Thiothrix sp. TaxID=223185 RepID=UPI00260AD2DE|nr:alkaline phosphatase D family protein [uncultured Thiothrix sp.]